MQNYQLTVTALCYQEIRFIRAWLENVLLFADKILISEGGSTDGTLDVIAEYQQRHPGRIEVFSFTQYNTGHHNNCEEGKRRNMLLNRVNDGYVIVLDIDELLPDNTREIIDAVAHPERILIGRWINFWRNPHLIRVGVPHDIHWGPSARAVLFPAGRIQYVEDHAHAAPIINLATLCIPELPVFHYHYLFAQPKERENRMPEWEGAVDPEIRLKVFKGRHPRALGLLSETVRFGDLPRPNRTTC